MGGAAAPGPMMTAQLAMVDTDVTSRFLFNLAAAPEERLKVSGTVNYSQNVNPVWK